MINTLSGPATVNKLFLARVGLHTLRARTGKYKFGARAGGRSWGPGPGPGAKKKPRVGKYKYSKSSAARIYNSMENSHPWQNLRVRVK